MPPPVIRMARLIDDYCTCQNKDLIFLRRDLDSVRISPAEPLLRDRCNRKRASAEDILVVGEIPFRFQVVRPGNVHGKAMMDK
jgi:hypothetical protein